MIIDAHAHMTHSSLATWLEANGGSWGKNRAARTREAARSRPHSVNVELRVDQLDRHNVDFQVVTPPGGGGLGGALPADGSVDRLAIARAINDGMARLMEESKGRLIGGGTIPVRGFENGGEKEMLRATRDLGLRAITVPSHFDEKPLDGPELEAFWAQAAEIGVPIYIHPISPERHRDRTYEGDYDLSHTFGWPFESILALSRLVFSGILERYPTLKVVGHHLGGGIPFWWGRISETYDLDWVERGNEAILKGLSKPLFDYFSLFYYDTAVGGSASAIRSAYEVFGADRLLFATDAPNGPKNGEIRLATYPGVIMSLGLPEADNKKIFADNARKMLNLP